MSAPEVGTVSANSGARLTGTATAAEPRPWAGGLGADRTPRSVIRGVQTHHHPHLMGTPGGSA